MDMQTRKNQTDLPSDKEVNSKMSDCEPSMRGDMGDGNPTW